METKLFVEGMKCGHCAARVEKAIAALGASAKVDLESKIVTVQLGSVSESAVKEAIEKAGYKVL